MTFVRLIPVLVSFLLLAAHFLRAGLLPLALASLALPLVLLVARPSAARLVQVVLVLGALEWVRTVLVVVAQRTDADDPWIRAAVILGAVATFTAASALVFLSAALRRRYRLGEPSDGQPPAQSGRGS